MRLRDSPAVRRLVLNTARAPWEAELPAGLRRTRLPWGRHAGSGPAVPVYWSRSGRRTNFGDELTWLMVRQSTGRSVAWAPFNRPCLVGAGSVLEWLDGSPGGLHGVVVWGAGAMAEGGALRLPGATVTAVRGQLSAARLVDGPGEPVLGDPGLLVSRVFPFASEESDELLFIPHYADEQSAEVAAFRARHPEWTVLSARGNPLALLDRISRARFVLSSALHPLIVADAYGVPNAWARLSDRVIGGGYKVRDYCSVFGVAPDPVDLDEVPVRSQSWLAERAESCQRPGLAVIQDALAAALVESLALLDQQVGSFARH